MKRLFLIFGLVASINVFGQESESTLQKVFRINMISPGIEFELPNYISPFLDLSYKRIYNQQKRASKGKISITTLEIIGD